MRMMRSSGNPAIFFQRSKASSSVWSSSIALYSSSTCFSYSALSSSLSHIQNVLHLHQGPHLQPSPHLQRGPGIQYSSHLQHGPHLQHGSHLLHGSPLQHSSIFSVVLIFSMVLIFASCTKTLKIPLYMQTQNNQFATTALWALVRVVCSMSVRQWVVKGHNVTCIDSELSEGGRHHQHTDRCHK